MTTTTKEDKPPALPRPFDERAIDALAVELSAADRARAHELLRDVYARGLEHAAAVNAYVRAQRLADAEAVQAPDEKKRHRAAAVSLERAAEGIVRTAELVRGGGDTPAELDELRAFVLKKGEPDPASVLGWLAVERKRSPTSTATTPEPKAAAESCVGTLLVRGPRVALPARDSRDPGVAVVIAGRGYLRRVATDRRPGSLEVVVEVHCTEEEPIAVTVDDTRSAIDGDDVDALVGGVAARGE